jgi:CubicO group peptidase (beta-lactamase class C family)
MFRSCMFAIVVLTWMIPSARSQTPITWATAGDVMDQAAKDEFDGAVLLTRKGKVVLNKGYGFANREKGIENRKETVFAIGSAPIDFTHAGILLLQDRGKLSIEDPITNYFANVPEDKQAITIKHLMNGQSGLPDFHELPTDTNPDHSWIDRREAIRRIMNQRLLFEPGKKREHSHSGWGLLAAIIEITSGESYQEFTTENLFKPAGMTDTGFFGDAIPENRIAIGYGSQQSSEPNSPPNWGKTSWLVMGSGGQISTLTDMYRWEVAMRNGSILSPDSSAAYLRTSNGVAQDGDSFGFEFMHSKDPDQLFMIISNSVNTREDRQSFDRLGNRLYRMIAPSKD